MDFYKCKKCGKKFDKRSNLITHLNKKNSCVKEPLKCEDCNKTFTRKFNLDRHTKTCKVKLNKITNTIVNNYTTNIGDNNTNTNIVYGPVINICPINLIAHGKEKLKEIPADKKKEFISAAFRSVFKMVEYIHCNDKFPEYRNICKTNLSDDKVLVFDGEDWEIKFFDDIYDELFSRFSEFLIGEYSKMKNNLNEFIVERFERFMKKYETRKTIDYPKNEIMLALRKNRKKINRNKK